MFGKLLKKDVGRSPRRALIHIGKCGGASLKETLREAGIADELQFIHIQPPVFRKDLRYIIVARNPLERSVSAFNWRYKLVVIDEIQRHRFPGEHEVLTQWGSLEALSEALYDDDNKPRPMVIKDLRTIHHIREDISFVSVRSAGDG